MAPVAIAQMSSAPDALTPRHTAARSLSSTAPPTMTPSNGHIISNKTNGSMNMSKATPWEPTQHYVTPRSKFEFDSMEDALEAFKAGEFLVVVDDENRENEGDLITSASQCTTEKMAWMIKHTSGYICVALPQERLEQLQIPMMVSQNEDRHKTAYTVTVDYKHGTSTGISAHDRALTVRSLASSASSASDFTRPGHMVPLRSRSGGTLVRKRHTESATDLCMLTGLPLAGVLCELVNDDEQGTMARRDDCRAFADRWGLKLISVDMLAEWRRTEGAS